MGSNNRADVIICQLINEYEGTWTALSDVSELKVTASSSHTEYTPDNLKNKKSKVPWHSEGNEGKNQWLMFEFPEPQRVDGFRMQAYYASKLVRSWMGSSFKDYRFEKSNDGKTCTTIKSGQGKDLNCCEWQEIRWISSSSAKFFRLYMVNNWGNARWQSIYKLELSLETTTQAPKSTTPKPTTTTISTTATTTTATILTAHTGSSTPAAATTTAATTVDSDGVFSP